MKNYAVKQFLKFKNPHEDIDLAYLHPNLLMVVGYIGAFCLEHGIEPVFTSVVRSKVQNEKYNSRSMTHVQGRAVDMSLNISHGWNYELTQKLVDDLNTLVNLKPTDERPNPFYNVGAISSKDLVQRVIVIHKNWNAPESSDRNDFTHAHIQVRPDEDWAEYLK